MVSKLAAHCAILFFLLFGEVARLERFMLGAWLPPKTIPKLPSPWAPRENPSMMTFQVVSPCCFPHFSLTFDAIPPTKNTPCSDIHDAFFVSMSRIAKENSKSFRDSVEVYSGDLVMDREWRTNLPRHDDSVKYFSLAMVDTPLKTNISPEKWCLEDVISFWHGLVSGDILCK